MGATLLYICDMNETQTQKNIMNNSTNYAQSAAIEALESVRFMLQAEMARNEGDNPKQVRAFDAARIELNKVREALGIVKGLNIG